MTAAINVQEQLPKKNGWSDIVKTVIRHRKDGDKIVTTPRWKNTLLNVLTVVGMCVSLAFIAVSTFLIHIDNQAIDDVKPQLIAQVEKGNTDAIVTLTYFYPNESKTSLDQLAEQGNDQAQFLSAIIKCKHGDKEGAIQMMERSADKGNLGAMRFLKLNEKYGYWAFKLAAKEVVPPKQ